jgi:FdhD protein
MPIAGTKSIELLRVEKGITLPIVDSVSVEEPLEIQMVSGKKENRSTSSISVTMRTPGNDSELAVGFLLTEGLLQGEGNLLEVDSVSDNIIKLHLDYSLKIDIQSLSRNFYTTSSCGVCGKASIDAIKVPSKKLEDKLTVDSTILKGLSGSLFDAQENFQSTGGLHASALFDTAGNLMALREDVGRHNALDKLIGNQFLQKNVPINDSILLVSGRASFELVQKAAVAGIPIMAAIGAPSNLAVELAQERGITLIGFLKSDRFNIYTHPKRIKLNEQRRV